MSFFCIYNSFEKLTNYDQEKIELSPGYITCQNLATIMQNRCIKTSMDLFQKIDDVRTDVQTLVDNIKIDL